VEDYNKRPIGVMTLTERCKLGATGELTLRLQNSIVCHAARCTPDFVIERNHRTRVVGTLGPLPSRPTVIIVKDEFVCRAAAKNETTDFGPELLLL